MAPIRNGLNFSHLGIPLCLALALCLTPVVANAQSAVNEEAAPESAAAEPEDAAVAAIDAFIAAHNPTAIPFQWRKATIRPKPLATRIMDL